MIEGALRDEVLDRLGAGSAPTLDELYGAWSEQVPWDNVQKRIFFAGAVEGPVPGFTPEAFFRDWLAHGTGGTCWSGTTALWALLRSLGFDARLVAASMLHGEDGRPNHGSVVIPDGDAFIMVDSSMLTRRPLRVQRGERLASTHPTQGPSVDWTGAHCLVTFPVPGRPSPLTCRLDAIDVPIERVREWHDGTRTTSPFNGALTLRVNRGDSVVGVAFGRRSVLTPEGPEPTTVLDLADMQRMLVDEAGMSEEIAAQLPPDEAYPAWVAEVA